MHMQRNRFWYTFLAVTPLLAMGGMSSVYANNEEIGTIVTVPAVKIDADATASGSSTEETTKKMNQFLIQSYKIRFDKTLAELEQNISGMSVDVQISVLQEVSGAVGKKEDILRSTKSISGNRKIVLGAVFEYIQQKVDSAILARTTSK